MKNLTIKSAFIISAFCLINLSAVSAQNGNANGGGPGNNNGNGNGNGNSGQGDAGCGNCLGNNGNGRGNKGSTNVPIDGGASLLLAAGAAYGLKKLKESRKKQDMSEPAA